MIEQHFKALPNEIVKLLIEEFRKMHKQYYLGNWEPSQLNGGRFAEIILRVIEYKDTGSYTPIKSKIGRKKIVGSAMQNTSLPDSLRIQISNIAELLLDFRNKRNVAHIDEIDVNSMDASFVINASNWVMAELLRLETKLSPDVAQKEIMKIIERKIPIIEDFDGRLKCLSPKLKTIDEILVFCYQKYPEYLSDEILFNWSKEKNKTRFKNYICVLDKKRFVDYYKNAVKLSKAGIVFVEKNIKFEIEV